MLEFAITNGHGQLRLIRPFPGEPEESFYRRMETMAHLLGERAPHMITLVVRDSDNGLVCVVSHDLPSGAALAVGGCGA